MCVCVALSGIESGGIDSDGSLPLTRSSSQMEMEPESPSYNGPVYVFSSRFSRAHLLSDSESEATDMSMPCLVSSSESESEPEATYGIMLVLGSMSESETEPESTGSCSGDVFFSEFCCFLSIHVEVARRWF